MTEPNRGWGHRRVLFLYMNSDIMLFPFRHQNVPFLGSVAFNVSFHSWLLFLFQSCKKAVFHPTNIYPYNSVVEKPTLATVIKTVVITNN